jgi:Siphovirus Gp157
MDDQLAILVSQHEYLLELVRTEFPDVDQDALRETVAGLTNLSEMLASLLRSHLDDIAILAALRTRILDMQERFARIEYRADKKRTLVASVMERAGIKKLTEPDFTASLREVPPGLIVIEEAKIPEAFWKPQPPKLDRKALLAALKVGEVVAGAALGNGSSTLAVRTR